MTLAWQGHAGDRYWWRCLREVDAACLHGNHFYSACIAQWDGPCARLHFLVASHSVALSMARLPLKKKIHGPPMAHSSGCTTKRRPAGLNIHANSSIVRVTLFGTQESQSIFSGAVQKNDQRDCLVLGEVSLCKMMSARRTGMMHGSPLASPP